MLVNFGNAPGDTLSGSLAVKQLATAHPEFAVSVAGTAASEIFQGCPWVVPLDGSPDCSVTIDNPLIGEVDKYPCHVLGSFCNSLASKIGVPVPLTGNAPVLCLTDQEKGWMNQVEQQTGYKGAFAVICTGRKKGVPVKGYPHYHWQKVVDHFLGRLLFVQCGEQHPDHNHQPLRGTLNLIGKTSIRQLIRLCHHSAIGLGGESFLNHIYGALAKPFVCICSGWLNPRYVAYSTASYLTRFGMLPCCVKSCWKNHVTLEQAQGDRNKVCSLPVMRDVAEPVPKCLDSISPDEVIAAVTAFIDGGLVKL